SRANLPKPARAPSKPTRAARERPGPSGTSAGTRPSWRSGSRSLTDDGNNAAAAHFERKRPGWLTKNVFNRIFALLTRLGMGMWGAGVLEVRGRKSGTPRRTPVNLLTFEG